MTLGKYSEGDHTILDIQHLTRTKAQALNVKFIAGRHLGFQRGQSQAVGVIPPHNRTPNYGLHFATKCIGDIPGKFVVGYIQDNHLQRFRRNELLFCQRVLQLS